MSLNEENEEKPSAPIKPAATVMVVRPANNGNSAFEVFMVRRSAKSAFVPDMFVFPGGSLDATDSTSQSLERIYGLTPAEAKASFRDIPELGAWDIQLDLPEEQVLGLYLATLRELFEEAGVLFAVDIYGQPFEVGADGERRQRFAAYRQQVHKNELKFIEMLEKENLKADVSRLIYFSHWITPKQEVRRFDTRFFLAIATPDQEAEADNIETTEGVWISPQEALKRHKEGTFSMIYPTIAHLQRLAAQPDLEALQEYARTKEIIAASPEVRKTEKGFTFKLTSDVSDRW